MPQIDPIILTFGGGINSRKRVHDVNIDECVSGENFELDPQQRALQKRRAFDLAGTAPNGGEIRGFAQLITQSDVITTLVQAGTNVYSWNGESVFTLVGTVSATAKLRGPREHNFLLDNIVVITDLNKAEVVKQWDGTTFANFTHNLGTSLYAKFARVVNERLLLGNVTSGTATPHVLLGSALGASGTLTTTNRPSSALGFDASFYIPTPDLRPINGIEAAFGQLLISTTRGRMYALKGASAFDFEIAPFYDGSSASGDEAMTNIGNDIIFGQPNHIESLSGVINFGDVQSNDVSSSISPSITNVTGWKIVYDRRRQKVFCFPDSDNVCWVLYKPLLGGETSPWSKWTTAHVMDMSPTAVMAMVNPATLQDAVYCGDSSGKIYLLDGEGATDGGTSNITVIRRSGMITIPNSEIFDVKVNIDYRRIFPATVTMRFLFSGMETPDATLSFSLAGSSAGAAYGGTSYYGGAAYYAASFTGKIIRTQKHAQGRGSGLQVEIECTSDSEIDIQQVEIILEAA